MTEFERNGWERELAAWRRRTAAGAGTRIADEVDALAEEVRAIRGALGDDGDDNMRARITFRLARLRDLFEDQRVAD